MKKKKNVSFKLTTDVVPSVNLFSCPLSAGEERRLNPVSRDCQVVHGDGLHRGSNACGREMVVPEVDACNLDSLGGDTAERGTFSLLQHAIRGKDPQRILHFYPFMTLKAKSRSQEAYNTRKG